MEELLASLASLASQKPEEYLTTLKGEDGEFLSQDKVAEKLKGDITAHYRTVAENQYKRGHRESMEDFEKRLRADYGLQSTETGLNLIKELVEKNKGTEKVIEKPLDLTEETALNHPVVKRLFEGKLKDEVRAKTTEAEERIKEIEHKYTSHLKSLDRERVLSAVRANAAQVLDGIKAKLEDEKGDKSTRLNFFLDTLNPDSFKLDGDGKPYPVNEKGEELEDPKTFHKISFADLIKLKNPYGTHEHDPNKSSASPSTKTGSSAAGSTIRFEDQTDFITRFNAATGEAKKRLKEAWKQQQAEAK